MCWRKYLAIHLIFFVTWTGQSFRGNTAKEMGWKWLMISPLIPCYHMVRLNSLMAFLWTHVFLYTKIWLHNISLEGTIYKVMCAHSVSNKTFRYGHNVLFTYHIMDFTASEDSTTWHYWPHKHSVSFSSTILQPDNISLQYNKEACLGLPINELNLTKWRSHIFITIYRLK